MTIQTLDLTDFLLARIADVEKFHRAHDGWCSYLIVGDPCDCPRKSALIECEAKRQIVDLLSASQTLTASQDDYGITIDARGLLNLLALPYADHPDYCEEWKP